jgi:hypothetical protein
MTSPIRWRVQDRFGNSIYLTQERWEHIIDPLNHPEMENYEEGLKETVQSGTRKQDSLNPQITRTLLPLSCSGFKNAESAKLNRTILSSLLTRKK